MLAEDVVSDIPREMRLEQRFACLQALSGSIQPVLGEAHNSEGFQDQHLVIPELEAVVAQRKVCPSVVVCACILGCS